MKIEAGQVQLRQIVAGVQRVQSPQDTGAQIRSPFGGTAGAVQVRQSLVPEAANVMGESRPLACKATKWSPPHRRLPRWSAPRTRARNRSRRPILKQRLQCYPTTSAGASGFHRLCVPSTATETQTKATRHSKEGISCSCCPSHGLATYLLSTANSSTISTTPKAASAMAKMAPVRMPWRTSVLRSR